MIPLYRVNRGYPQYELVNSEPQNESLEAQQLGAGSLPKNRQHFLLILFQRIFLISAHQINIELSNSRASQRTKFFNVRFSRTQQAEAVCPLNRHKVAVAAVDFAMMKVIVLPAIAYVRSQSRREFLRLVARNQIDDMVRHQSREPAHAFPPDFQIVRNPDRRSCHDLNLLRIPSRHSIKSGSANCKMTPSATRPASSSTFGPYPATHTGGTPPVAHVSRAFPSSYPISLPLVRSRKSFTDSSNCATVTGFLPSTRRELSPRPMPSCMRPPEIKFSVANRLDVTVMSRVAGFVTQVPSRIFFVFVAMSVSMG